MRDKNEHKGKDMIWHQRPKTMLEKTTGKSTKVLKQDIKLERGQQEK